MEAKCEARELPFVTPGVSFATMRQSPGLDVLQMLNVLTFPSFDEFELKKIAQRPIRSRCDRLCG